MIFQLVILKIAKNICNIIKYRPDSYPYISGDTFRKFADHIFDETSKCNPVSIKENESVFLKTDLIDLWFKDIHPSIKSKYILITHNSDACIGEKQIEMIDDKIVHWFAQNNTYAHPKVTPIPIGIENKYLFGSGYVLLKNIKILTNRRDRENKILSAFNEKTNIGERSLALKNLTQSSIADVIHKKIKNIDYYSKLANYKFVASPEGNGPDCIRTWEAIILGIVPIIKNTSNLEILKYKRLPILIINSWDEIKNISEEYLSMKYSEIMSASNIDIIYSDYWKDKISYFKSK